MFLDITPYGVHSWTYELMDCTLPAPPPLVLHTYIPILDKKNKLIPYLLFHGVENDDGLLVYNVHVSKQ